MDLTEEQKQEYLKEAEKREKLQLYLLRSVGFYKLNSDEHDYPRFSEAFGKKVVNGVELQVFLKPQIVCSSPFKDNDHVHVRASLDPEKIFPGFKSGIYTEPTIRTDYGISNFNKAYTECIGKVNNAIQTISKTKELSDKLE